VKLKPWQVVWTALVVVWLAASALPMVILQLKGDSEQLAIYFGMWIAVVLIPTFVVYSVGLLFGKLVANSVGHSDSQRRASRSTSWLLTSSAWILLVGAFCVFADGPTNPFYRFAWPLAAAIALLLAMVPPVLVYFTGRIVGRSRRSENDN
jgi:peptidoglycan/LPS O-acetylase OafA/YrhL